LNTRVPTSRKWPCHLNVACGKGGGWLRGRLKPGVVPWSSFFHDICRVHVLTGFYGRHGFPRTQSVPRDYRFPEDRYVHIGAPTKWALADGEVVEAGVHATDDEAGWTGFGEGYAHRIGEVTFGVLGAWVVDGAVGVAKIPAIIKDIAC